MKQTKIETSRQVSTNGLAQGLYFYQIKDKTGRLAASGKVVKSEL